MGVTHSWVLLRGGCADPQPCTSERGRRLPSLLGHRPIFHQPSSPTLILFVPVVPGTSSAKTRTLSRKKKKTNQHPKPTLCFSVPKLLIINIHNTKPVKPVRQNKAGHFIIILGFNLVIVSYSGSCLQITHSWDFTPPARPVLESGRRRRGAAGRLPGARGRPQTPLQRSGQRRGGKDTAQGGSRRTGGRTEPIGEHRDTVRRGCAAPGRGAGSPLPSGGTRAVLCGSPRGCAKFGEDRKSVV